MTPTGLIDGEYADKELSASDADESDAGLAARDVDFIKAEVESMDPGPIATTEDEKILYRYLRVRQLVATERQRIADQVQMMLRAMDNRLEGLDYVYIPIAADIVRRMLEGKKTKSVKTPFGTVGFRTLPTKLDVIDEAKIYRAIADEELPIECKRVTIKIDISELNKNMKSTGEIPPGCEMSGGGEKFYVK